MEQLGIWLVVGVWCLNLFISWWNARVTGLSWAEANEMGGFTRLLIWCGGIMSACGFTWCYLIAFTFGAYITQPAWIGAARELLEQPQLTALLTEESVTAVFQLGYVMLIPVIILSGIVIWAHSVAQAWRRKDLASIGIAGYNTYAQGHNMYNAMRGLPEAFSGLRGFFSGRGGRGAGGAIVFLLVAVALLAGVLTTWAIVNHYAGKGDLPEPRESAG